MQRITALAPIADVTVLEDRAQILRRGRVSVPAGPCQLAIDGVAPVLADKTLVARVASGARVVDARCERLALPVPSDPQRGDGAARERLRLATEQVSSLEQEMKRSEARLALAVSAGKLAVSEMAIDAAAGRADADTWRSALADAAARELGERQRLVGMREQLGDARRSAADLHAQLQQLGSPPPMRTTAVVTIDAAAAGEIELELGYVVPGACWRPAHTAQLNGAELRWTAEGCVWQNSGESWNAVRLFLSTDRASLGTDPPELVADRLRLQPREQAVVVESRDREVEDTGPTGGSPASDMPGIDDGGEARVLPVQGQATVPADGRPHRFPLATFTTAATAELIVHGEIAAAAVLRTRQANPLPAPLLAGPVDLLRGGGLAGRASIAYVAPGAGFDLGWGAEAGVRVRRSARTIEEKSGALSAWTPRLHQIDLIIANLGSDAKRLVVAERIPVSEVEAVRIELDPSTAPATTPDDDGICRWPVELPGNGRSEIRLRWRLLTKGNVSGV